MFDTNVSLFRWPFRRLPLDETEALVRRLRELGVARALAGSFEGVLHRDCGAVNRRLAEECARFSELLPVGTIDPGRPGWESDLEECAGELGMRAIRLFPNYHGYALGDRRFHALLERAATAGLLVQVAVALEDTRTQHRLVAVPDVDLGPLPEAVGRVPGVLVQVLNDRPRGAYPEALLDESRISFDVARVDGTDGVARLRDMVGWERVLFGSHAPFLIPEAALIRTVHESGLAEHELRCIVGGNAERLLFDKA